MLTCTTTDRFGLLADEASQLATIRAGWRFYLRAAARDDTQQALAEWVDAVESVLDLGVEPASLLDFSECLAEALQAAKDEELKGAIRVLLATLAPHPLAGVVASIRALKGKQDEPPSEDPPLDDAAAVAVDLGVGSRSAQHVSTRLRANAA